MSAVQDYLVEQTVLNHGLGFDYRIKYFYWGAENTGQLEVRKKTSTCFEQLFNSVKHYHRRQNVASEEIIVVLGAHQVTIYMICNHKVCLQLFLGTFQNMIYENWSLACQLYISWYIILGLKMRKLLHSTNVTSEIIYILKTLNYISLFLHMKICRFYPTLFMALFAFREKICLMMF